MEFDTYCGQPQITHTHTDREREREDAVGIVEGPMITWTTHQEATSLHPPSQ